MRIEVVIYKLTDARGDSQYKVVNDSSEKLCIGGFDAEGEYHQFDSYEAYHLGSFVAEHPGFSYDSRVCWINLPEDF